MIRKPCPVPAVSLQRGFLSPRALTGNLWKAFQKTSIVKTILFWQILQHMLLVWAQPLPGGKQSEENARGCCQLEKNTYYVQIGATHSGQFLFNWEWGGPFLGRNVTDCLTGKIQSPPNHFFWSLLNYPQQHCFPRELVKCPKSPHCEELSLLSVLLTSLS